MDRTLLGQPSSSRAPADEKGSIIELKAALTNCKSQINFASRVMAVYGLGLYDLREVLPSQ